MAAKQGDGAFLNSSEMSRLRLVEGLESLYGLQSIWINLSFVFSKTEPLIFRPNLNCQIEGGENVGDQEKAEGRAVVSDSSAGE